MKTISTSQQQLTKILSLLILLISLGGGSLIAQTSGQRCFENGNPGCASCLLKYPDNSNLPRSATIFSESTCLVASDPTPATCGLAPTQIRLWYTDEHAMTLGVRQVVIKNANGTTTTTNYGITPTPASPTCVINPLVGTTIASGDQSGNDQSDRPVWPVLYLTDLTINGASSRVVTGSMVE